MWGIPPRKPLWRWIPDSMVGSVWWQFWAYPLDVDRPPGREFAQLGSVLAVFGVAVTLRRRRPDSRMWKLVLVLLAAGLLEDLGPPCRFLVTVGLFSDGLSMPAFSHLVLAYPSGRLIRRSDRAFVYAAYVLAFRQRTKAH